jgi:hypothetical protein
LSEIEQIVREHQIEFLEVWYEHLD